MSNQGDSGDMEDDWSNVTDPQEKRRIQVRNAQRRFRARVREKEEEERRAEANERLAGSSYSGRFNSDDADDRNDSSHPPWGQIPVGYGIRLNRNMSDPSSPQGETNPNTSDKAGEQGDASGSQAATGDNTASNQGESAESSKKG